jgi:hypothetical protein
VNSTSIAPLARVETAASDVLTSVILARAVDERTVRRNDYTRRPSWSVRHKRFSLGLCPFPASLRN